MKQNFEEIERVSKERTHQICAIIGNLINQKRISKGLSVRELARKSRSSSSNISDLETGKHLPSIETLLRFSLVLGIPFKELFGIPESFIKPKISNIENTLTEILVTTGLKRVDIENVLEFIRFKLHKQKVNKTL